MIPLVSEKHCDGMVSTQILLVGRLRVSKLGYFGKAPDTLSIISHESKKCTYLFGYFWWMHVFDGLSFQWQGSIALGTVYMS